MNANTSRSGIFAKKVAASMRKRRVNEEQIANEIGISKRLVQRVCEGKTIPNGLVTKRMSEILHIDTGENRVRVALDKIERRNGKAFWKVVSNLRG